VLAPSIKNLIFDLGGVILDLSVESTLDCFTQLSGMPKEKVKDLFISSPGFIEYEKGSIDDKAFRDFLKATYSVSASDDEIDRCWNAMLVGIPPAKLDLLKRLQNEFRVYLLSNTNGIHIQHINGTLLPEMKKAPLEHYFHKAYYSHSMGKRKPDAEIFEQVIEENHLVPEQTLFLDDYAVNIEGAKSVGIKTIHVTSPSLILDYFHA
jgi:epoxide hydrolase-like predicted phosphatase